MGLRSSVSRVHEQTAYVLHAYDWSESSLILEIFSRDWGRLAVMAKGVKKPTSQFRNALLPLQRLRLSWSGEADIRTLTRCEWDAGGLMPAGDSLMAGLYLNELLLKLLAREDAHTALFEVYDHVVRHLDVPLTRATSVRAFELLLLRELGLLPALDVESSSLQAVQPHERYDLRADGLVGNSQGTLTGGQCLQLHEQLFGNSAHLAGLWEVIMTCEAELRSGLRDLLLTHSGQEVFRTRAVVDEIRQLSQAARFQAES